MLRREAFPILSKISPLLLEEKKNLSNGAVMAIEDNKMEMVIDANDANRGQQNDLKISPLICVHLHFNRLS